MPHVALSGVISPSSDRVLVVEGGNGQSRSAVAAVRAVHAAGFAPVVAHGVAGSLAARSRRCVATVRVPEVDEPGFAPRLHQLAVAGYRGVLLASDAAMLALDAPGAALVDKEHLATVVDGTGLRMPTQRVFADAAAVAAAADGLEYPVVLKPVRKPGAATPAAPARSAAEVLRWAAASRDPDAAVAVQPFLEGETEAIAGVVRGGALLAVVQQRYLRTWPRGCGTASAAVTVTVDGDRAEGLLRLLAGFDGIFQAQFIGGRLIDLNPRVYGSLPLALAAGVNLVGIHLAALSGVVAPRVTARPGVGYRWLEGDLRHLVSAVRSGDVGMPVALRDAVPRPGTAHSLAALGDPGPLLGRLVYAATRRG